MKTKKKIMFFILELIFYYALTTFVLVDFLDIGDDFFDLNLHPFLIIIGIMSYRYGVNLGIVSATFATLLYIYLYVNLGHDLIVFFYSFEHYKFILMFFTFSFILGRIKENQIDRVNNLKEEICLLRGNYKKIHDNNNKLTYINTRMKSQIIKSEESIIALYNISSILDTLNPEEIITNSIEVFKTYINAEVISLYTVDKNKKYMRLKLATGRNRKLPNSIKLSEYPDFMKVIEDKKYGKRDGHDLKTPVFYAPILSEGEVIGILNIERLSYHSYTTYTEKMFEILVSWTSKSISNALSYTQSLEKEMYYDGTKIMHKKYFEIRMKEEQKREEKFDISYIMIKYKVLVDDLKKITLSIREGDSIGYYEKDKILSIIFPVTSLKLRKLLNSKILEENIGILEDYYEN